MLIYIHILSYYLNTGLQNNRILFVIHSSTFVISEANALCVWFSNTKIVLVVKKDVNYETFTNYVPLFLILV